MSPMTISARAVDAKRREARAVAPRSVLRFISILLGWAMEATVNAAFPFCPSPQHAMGADGANDEQRCGRCRAEACLAFVTGDQSLLGRPGLRKENREAYRLQAALVSSSAIRNLKPAAV